MCRFAFEYRVHPPRPGLLVAAGNFRAFLADGRGAITLDWLTLSAGAAGLAALMVAAISYFDLLNGEALAARLEEDARAQVVSVTRVDRVDPGAQYAPGAPVFDPGGRDPGALTAPATLPTPTASAPDAAPSVERIRIPGGPGGPGA